MKTPTTRAELFGTAEAREAAIDQVKCHKELAGRPSEVARKCNVNYHQLRAWARQRPRGKSKVADKIEKTLMQLMWDIAKDELK